jgi:hypothetical protein
MLFAFPAIEVLEWEIVFSAFEKNSFWIRISGELEHGGFSALWLYSGE